MKNYKNRYGIWIKTIATLVICLFTFSGISWALAPEARLARTEFQEQYLAHSTLLAHKAVNEYIESIISEAGINTLKHREDFVPVSEGVRQHILIVAIPGLLKNTGQFAHVGLGRKNGMPVIYADEKYYYNEDVIQHDKDEIAKWENKRRELGLDYEEMRDWIRTSPEAKGLARKFHEESQTVDDVNSGTTDKYKDFLDWDNIYAAYQAFGLDEDDSDVNIAAYPEDTEEMLKALEESNGNYVEASEKLEMRRPLLSNWLKQIKKVARLTKDEDMLKRLFRIFLSKIDVSKIKETEYPESLEEALKALEESKGNQKKAAEKLKVSRPKLSQWLRQIRKVAEFTEDEEILERLFKIFLSTIDGSEVKKEEGEYPEDVEKILKALEESAGDQVKAAKKLRVRQSTLSRWLTQIGETAKRIEDKHVLDRLSKLISYPENLEEILEALEETAGEQAKAAEKLKVSPDVLLQWLLQIRAAAKKAVDEYTLNRLPENVVYPENLEEVLRALKNSNGKYVEAAKKLKVSRPTLSNWLRQIKRVAEFTEDEEILKRLFKIFLSTIDASEIEKEEAKYPEDVEEILNALEGSAGEQAKAAEKLKVSPPTLSNRLRQIKRVAKLTGDEDMLKRLFRIFLSKIDKPEIKREGAEYPEALKEESKGSKSAKGSIVNFLQDIKNSDRLLKALRGDKGLDISEACLHGSSNGRNIPELFKSLEDIGVFVLAEGKSGLCRFSDMIIGESENYTKTMINAICDICFIINSGNKKRSVHFSTIPKKQGATVRELIKLVIIREISVMQNPGIAEGKVLWHIIDNKLLAPAQRHSSFAQKINKFSLESKKSEKIWILNKNETIEDAMEKIRKFHSEKKDTDKEPYFDVALNSTDQIDQVPESVKVLVFRGEVGDFSQIGAVITALRALHLHRTEIVASLLNIYSALNGTAYTGDIPSVDFIINSPKEFAKRFIFVLPPVQSLPINDIPKLNDRLLEILMDA
jgi:DNA-binding transcriptional regulator YdaS (Cro superfamily)